DRAERTIEGVARGRLYRTGPGKRLRTDRHGPRAAGDAAAAASFCGALGQKPVSFRHCERSEAIQKPFIEASWIASSLPLLAMTAAIKPPPPSTSRRRPARS